MRLHPLYLALSLALAGGLVGCASIGPANNSTSTAQVAMLAPYTTVEGINEYRLSNGMRVLLAPDASKPTTTVNVTYLVGSRHESYGETGMAHLLEHLLFKGTKNRPNIMQELGKRGMSFNGTTFFDRTNYYETFPASAANLQWALEMEADRMVNARIAKADLETEFSVVRNEMEMGENNPFRTLWKQLGAISFDWHNYGHNTIGARSDVEGVKIENLQNFYRKFYQPDNAVLMVAGKFDASTTLALIEKNFGKLSKPKRQLSATWTRESQRDGTREVTVKRVGDMQMAALLYPTSAGSHPDASALAALGEILGGTPNGRLHKQMVESKQAVGVGNMAFDLAEPGYAMFIAQLSKDQNIGDAKKSLIETVEGMLQQPVTEEELKRAKTALLNQIEQTMNDPQRLCVEMSESIAMGDWRLFFISRDRIEALTVTDLQRVAQNYFKEDNRSYGQYLPVEKADRTEIPTSPDVAKLVTDYKGRAAVAEGESFDASPVNIDARTEKLTLANGAKVALLAKKTRGETVKGQFTLHLGDEASLFNQSINADLSADMLMRGTGKLSRAEIDTRLGELKAQINIGGFGQNLTVTFETVREHLPSVLDLLHDILRTPSFPASEFDLLVKENLAAIEAQQSEPQAVAGQALSQAKNVLYKKGDIRYTDSFEGSMAAYKAAQLDHIKAFYKRFYGASSAEFALVGDFDNVIVKSKLNALFADWSSPTPFVRVPSLLAGAKPVSLLLETPDKANANYIAELPFALNDSAPDYAAMLVANKVLGGGSKSRLIERLRQKEGISYGAGSSFNASALDDVAAITLYAIYAPENLAKIQNGVKEELARLIKDGISEMELSDTKQALAQERNIRRAQDGSLAGNLRSQLFLGRSMAFDAALDAKIAGLTLAEVNGVLRKYLNADNFAHYYAGDFAGAARKAADAAAK